MKPKLPLMFKGIVLRTNNAAVYYDIQFVDANNKVWTVHNASFLHDMKEVTNTKPETLTPDQTKGE
jgi:hypothetical protein